ncbi:hypothetical protein [Salmonella enterica]|uniref:hypothetical protein n=1 Tax=Salmonella enterica TaxID=28901 RepID=UPI00403FBA65
MKQKEYRTVRITRHMRAGMLAAGLLLPLVAGAATSGGMLIPFTYRKLKNQSIPLSTPYAT